MAFFTVFGNGDTDDLRNQGFRYGARGRITRDYVVQRAAALTAAWLWGIIVNLLLIGNYYDVALRDFGLCLGALAPARLAAPFETRHLRI